MPERMESSKDTLSLLMRVKMIQSHWKTLWQFLTKLNILVPYDPAVMPLSLSKGPENYLLTKTCTQMFVTALFTLSKITSKHCLSVS